MLGDTFFIKNKNPITVVMIAILFGGFLSYKNLQTSLFPEITFPKVKIIADAGLVPVDKMMVTVTKPLENAIKKVPDLKVVRSTTSRGSCEISALLDWKADVDLSKQTIESRISEIRNNMPPEVQITVEKMNPSVLPVMGYTLESHNRSPIELKQIANNTIKPFLSQVDGISEVKITGGKEKEYWLVLDNQKMSSLGVTPDAISKALGQTNFIKSNGYLHDYRYLYLTLTNANVTNKSDLENIVISNNGKRIILMKDIAEVQISEASEYIKINANGRDGILVDILKQPNTNLLDITNDVEDKVEELKKTLPADVHIQPYYIQADFVKGSVRSVADSIWIGLLLAILVAVIFLRSWRGSATILFSIPLTIGLTFIVMYFVGFSFNIMTLGAMAAAIGLIIDDAVVVVEQLHRTHEENPNRPTEHLLHESISYLVHAMIGSSLSTIVIFIPFVLMTGVAGAYFKVMTETMIITLVCSFFVTWIALPILYLRFSKNQSQKQWEEEEEEEKVSLVKSQRWVSFFIKKPYLSFLFIIGLIVSMVLLLPRLETGFLPEMDEGSIVLDYSSPPGTSLEETDRMLHEVEKILVKIPEVSTYSRRTGTQMGFFITEPNRGDYLIQLNPKHKRNTVDVMADIRKQVASTQPALRIDFGQVIDDILGDLMTVPQPIEVKVFGEDQKVLHDLSRQIAAEITKVKGTADVFDGIVIAGPSISVEPDQAKLAQFGLSPAVLQYQLQSALEGNIVGTVPEKQKLINIRLVYPDSRKQTVEDIRHLQIFLPNGKLKPITELASVEVHAGDAEIQRENLQSMGVITARLDNRDLGGAVKEIKKQLSSKINLPLGYHIEYGGAYSEQQRSFDELLLILICVSILVFGVILFLFKEFKVALLILILAVLGISGSVLALYITHTPLNVGSYTGLIMIVGIIGENAIFTFLQFKETLSSEGVDESIIFSISTRLRPKLMTALGAIIALLPLALGIGTGSQLHQPLAIAVIGGFVVAMPLLLVVFPTFIRLIHKREL